MELACRTAGRNLTQEEWNQYFREEPYRKTCEHLPSGRGVSATPVVNN